MAFVLFIALFVTWTVNKNIDSKLEEVKLSLQAAKVSNKEQNKPKPILKKVRFIEPKRGYGNTEPKINTPFCQP